MGIVGEKKKRTTAIVVEIENTSDYEESWHQKKKMLMIEIDGEQSSVIKYTAC